MLGAHETGSSVFTSYETLSAFFASSEECSTPHCAAVHKPKILDPIGRMDLNDLRISRACQLYHLSGYDSMTWMGKQSRGRHGV